jgi:hypothetical protein
MLGRFHEDAGELGCPGVVRQRGTNHLAKALAEIGRRQLDARQLRDTEACDLGPERHPDGELGMPRREAHLLVAAGHVDHTVVKRPHDVGDKTARYEHTPVGITRDLSTRLDDEVRIRTDDFQLVTAE